MPVDARWPEECRYGAPPGPFEYRYYGRGGELLDRVPTIVGRPAPQGCLDALEELERKPS